MQQAGFHIWKQSRPHCHRRCTSPLQAVDCHRLAQKGRVLTATQIFPGIIENNGGKSTQKFISTMSNPQSNSFTDINVDISPKSENFKKRAGLLGEI